MADSLRLIVEKYNDAFTQNADLLDSDATPVAGLTTLTVTCAFSTSGVLSYRTVEGATEQNLTLNEGVALTADALYEFTFNVTSGVSYNFRYSGADGTTRVLLVSEKVSK